MILPTLAFEQKLWIEGYSSVAGIDEVGRGAWAGPVVAAAVIWPINNHNLPTLLRDSKRLSAGQREAVVGDIQSLVHWAIGQASVDEITDQGIVGATFLAMTRAANQLHPDYYLIDGFPHPRWPADKQQHVIKGDSLVASIAAASIIAKVYRDNLMSQLDDIYPGYNFASHKGYGTAKHQQAILSQGLSPAHRPLFVKNLLASA